MYVCVCNAVTERHITEAVREGSTTLRDLRQNLGVAAECGRCATCARDCLRAALATTRAPAPEAARQAFPLFLAMEAS